MKNFYKKTLLNLKKKKNLLYSNDNVHFVQIQMWKSIYNQQAYAKIPEYNEKKLFEKVSKKKNQQTSKLRNKQNRDVLPESAARRTITVAKNSSGKKWFDVHRPIPCRWMQSKRGKSSDVVTKLNGFKVPWVNRPWHVHARSVSNVIVSAC